MSGAARSYDVAVVGAGPVGSLCALAHARRGASVALLEANPNTSRRLAGEWLHPPALRILRDFAIALDEQPQSTVGKGFVVFPEDRSEPIVLRYPDGSRGLVCEHEALVSLLRAAASDEPGIDFMLGARVRAVEDQRVTFSRDGAEGSVQAALIVGADGRGSIVRRSLGLWTSPSNCSRMMGITLSGVGLPLEGYGHMVCGGPGPMLLYRLGEQTVRVIVDVPLGFSSQDLVAAMSDSYAGWLPEALRPAFLEALRERRFLGAANALRPRATYGSPRRVLIGDAAGHYHPLTAVGMTLGFGDALSLAEGTNFRDFTDRRFRATRAPELLAMGLYEIFADHRVESVALRQAIYRRWRESPAVRDRTVGLLACEDTSITSLGLACGAMGARAVVGEIPRSCERAAWRRTRDIVRALAVRLGWVLRGVRQLRKARNAGGRKDERARESLARAFLVSMPSGVDDLRPSLPEAPPPPDAGPALSSASRRLLSLQGPDGAWEGEVVWCPLLTAQYVLLHHILGRPLASSRRSGVLGYFERSRLEGGSWGLHAHAAPSLFVTALVYVAARLLGVEPDDPLIEPAGRFLRSEGVLGIPSWGKFWLALVGLYDWRGVNPVLPELWCLPRWTPLHPSKWYCHTRLIYMAMAVIHPLGHRAPVTPAVAAIREELFPQGFAEVDFASGRNRLRRADLFARPGVWLRAGYGSARLYERFAGKARRARCTEEILRRIRWELRTTDCMSISPVSGLLNILALWLRDPDDADCRGALARLEVWIWEDVEGGARLAGARSALWDTAFSLQALATVPELDGVADALRRGGEFVRREQIEAGVDGFAEAYRSDPEGGWCFSGRRHGWPVTDCTAEAVLGLLAADGEASAAALGAAARFMLRGQNRDGGFGSYEARRSAVGLEWLNPAEMFGESMTERSHVECTASCLAALRACREHVPELAEPQALRAASRAEAWLRRTQGRDGSWRGAWGVQFIYGTYFGVRGLLAAGARPGDPALRRACRWLLDRQRSDGGWGEHHSGCLKGRYVEHSESHATQTSWAMLALLEAGEGDWAAIARGARFLLEAQRADGQWPEQDGAGVFFRTAVLDYVLYRQYFPLLALGLYEQQRRVRLGLTPPAGASRLVA